MELAVKRQLAGRQRSPINSDGQADAIQVERYESLFRVAYTRAMAGDMRAQEQCRRLLVELGRLRGLVEASTVETPASRQRGPTGSGHPPGGSTRCGRGSHPRAPSRTGPGRRVSLMSARHKSTSKSVLRNPGSARSFARRLLVAESYGKGGLPKSCQFVNDLRSSRHGHQECFSGAAHFQAVAVLPGDVGRLES